MLECLVLKLCFCSAGAANDDDDGFSGVRFAFAETGSKEPIDVLQQSLTSVLQCFPELKSSEYGQFLEIVELWLSKFT